MACLRSRTPGLPQYPVRSLSAGSPRFLPLYVDRARDKRRQRERFYLVLYILILGGTGIRVGEARKLRWRDVSTTRTLISGDRFSATAAGYFRI